MPAFELVAAALPGATGPTSASPAARTAPPIHVFMRALPGPTHQPRKTGPPLAGPSQLAQKQLVLPAVLVAMMMPMITPVTVIAPMVMAPVHLGGDVLGVILHRGGGAGTGQRQCLGALGWSGQDQQRANGSKPQKSCHVHICILLWVMCVTPAPRG